MDLINGSGRDTVASTADISTERLTHTMISEMAPLQPDKFDNTIGMFDSLLMNNTRCNSVYLNEMLAKLGPEFPTLELGAVLNNTAPSDSDIRPHETTLNTAASNFVVDNCEEICPTRNDSGIPENSTALGEELVAIKGQLRQQQEMILTLKSAVKQQQDTIVDLQSSNSDSIIQLKRQSELILQLQRQLNTLTEINRQSLQTILDERQQQTQVAQEPTVDRSQSQIDENCIVTTNERSLACDSAQVEPSPESEIEIVQSPAEECNEGRVTVKSSRDDVLIVEEHPESLEVVQLAHARPVYETDNANKSKRSLRIKLVRSGRIREGNEKQISLNLNDDEASSKKLRNSRKKETKKHSCAVCKKQFNHKSHFIDHLRVHFGEKPYGCSDCNAAFSQIGNLITHQRIHAGEKPFICDICKKSFRRKSSLSGHMDIHSGTNYKCNECKKEFRQRSNLSRHLKIHCKQKLDFN